MAEEKFKLVSNYAPTGDQPQAIAQLVEGVQRGDRCQTLLGVTGSGKTFTMANVIAQCNRPTLVLAHNKTLAAQLCTEFRSFFPNNAVEYFVSYYDYYQPEAYIPSTDTYIEKDSAINDEIDRLRHSATAALSERRDVIIVASVSCIYSLGDPIDYRSMVISLRPGMQMERDELCKKLVTLQYERNDVNFVRNKFRVHGDTVDIYLAYMSELAIRVEFFGDEIDRITEFNPLTGSKQNVVKHVAIFPASHYIVSAEKKAAALEKIRAECDAQVKQFTAEGKLIEAQRIAQRTNYDIEMLNEVDTFERMEIIKDLRLGSIDVVVGINLLREGLDLPEVSLVAILDADKEGFLRSETSLIQTIGRAARNAEGMVIMYADVVTDSMERAITETERRRAIQMAYNEEHGIVPKTIVKAIADSIEISDKAENAKRNTRRMGKMEREAAIERLTREMKEAAKLLEFEHAAFLRDQIDRLRRGENPTVDSAAETERKQNHAQTQRKGRKYLGKR